MTRYSPNRVLKQLAAYFTLLHWACGRSSLPCVLFIFGLCSNIGGRFPVCLFHVRRLSRRQAPPVPHRHRDESSWAARCVLASYCMWQSTLRVEACLGWAQPRYTGVKNKSKISKSSNFNRSDCSISISTLHSWDIARYPIRFICSSGDLLSVWLYLPDSPKWP